MQGPAVRLRLYLHCEVSLKGMVWWPSVQKKEKKKKEDQVKESGVAVSRAGSL